MTIDFLPPDRPARPAFVAMIDEPTIVAMYMNNRAVESLTSGHPDDAYWFAREAVTQQPRFLAAYNTLGVVYHRHGDLALAQRAFELRAGARTRQHSRDVEPRRWCTREQGRTAVAAELERKGWRRSSRIRRSRTSSAASRRCEQRDYRLARDMFAKEVARAAYYHEFHFWLALADAGMGDMEGARKHMSIAIENSTTRQDQDFYAAKLSRLQGAVPVIRRDTGRSMDGRSGLSQ